MYCGLTFFRDLFAAASIRDVKPENIMYTSREEDANIKLTDFGLAMLYPGASVTQEGGGVGGQERKQVWIDNLVGTPG